MWIVLQLCKLYIIHNTFINMHTIFLYVIWSFHNLLDLSICSCISLYDHNYSSKLIIIVNIYSKRNVLDKLLWTLNYVQYTYHNNIWGKEGLAICKQESLMIKLTKKIWFWYSCTMSMWYMIMHLYDNTYITWHRVRYLKRSQMHGG